MTDPMANDEKPLDPAAAAIVARVRRLTLISGLFTVVAVGAVLAVIGYRVYRSEGSAPVAAADVTAALPKGAKVVGTAATEDRLVLTVEVQGATEIHTFNLKTLKPAGRLKLQSE
jgi:hypothetical protein